MSTRIGMHLLCLARATCGRPTSRSLVSSAGVVVLALTLAGCGDDDDDLPAPGNQAPAISISTSATFGVAQISTFTFTATVAEPDGNPVAVRWTLSDGTTDAGTTIRRTFPSWGTYEIVATASDHLGSSTTSNTVTVTVGSVTGEWSGTIDLAACESGTKPVTANLLQSGSSVSGTITLPEGFCTATPVTAAVVPGDGTRIFGAGGVRLHAVVPTSPDASFQGQLDTTGQKITGTLEGTEPSGLAFTLNRQ